MAELWKSDQLWGASCVSGESRKSMVVGSQVQLAHFDVGENVFSRSGNEETARKTEFVVRVVWESSGNEDEVRPGDKPMQHVPKFSAVHERGMSIDSGPDLVTGVCQIRRSIEHSCAIFDRGVRSRARQY